MPPVFILHSQVLTEVIQCVIVFIAEPNNKKVYNNVESEIINDESYFVDNEYHSLNVL